MTSRSQVPRTRVASLDVVAGRGDLDGVVPEVRQPKVPQQQPAVGVRIGAHPRGAARREPRMSARGRPSASNSSSGR